MSNNQELNGQIILKETFSSNKLNHREKLVVKGESLNGTTLSAAIQ